jgi:hypothetical protein
MDIEVDQSIRIKDAQDTVLAFSNTISRAIVIPAEVKRAAYTYLKTRYRIPKSPELKIFVVGLFLLLREHLSSELYITIDEEWTGEANEASIKGMLLNYIREVVPEFDKRQIRFARIGKKSGAHQKAYGVHRGKETPDYVATEKELLKLLAK